MPPYLRLGSIPPKRHTAHRHDPGFRARVFITKRLSVTTGFRATYSIVYHLRPPTRVRRSSRPGHVPADFGERRAAPPSPQDRVDPRSATRSPDASRSSATTT